MLELLHLFFFLSSSFIGPLKQPCGLHFNAGLQHFERKRAGCGRVACISKQDYKISRERELIEINS
jgi:hypothetical protein